MRFGFILIFLLLWGCGDYTTTTKHAREEFYAGKYTEAAKDLENDAHKESLNQLLFLFDRATALHQAGDYEESIKDFRQADQLAEIKDYTSLASEAATLITNDKIIPYKGEDFENVLISQYLALNYLMLHKYEDALVECRRVNHKLYMMISQGKRKYKLNPMARYLSALMYEDQHEWNDAYIDYKAVHQLLSDFPNLKEDLYRLAWKNAIREDIERWSKEYKLSIEDRKKIRETADLPEIVLIVANGKSPKKEPNPTWAVLPHFVPRFNPVSYIEVMINGQSKGRSHTLFDIEKTAIENLDEKYAGLIAKRIAGIAVKGVIADQVSRRTDSPLLGFLAWVGMNVMDQADLRSWLTLPKDFQVFRVHVENAGEYKIQVIPKDVNGTTVNMSLEGLEKIVHFEAGKPGQRAFVPIRVL